MRTLTMVGIWLSVAFAFTGCPEPPAEENSAQNAILNNAQNEQIKEIAIQETTMSNPNYNRLSAEEAKVILHKGTEPPRSGKYDDFFEQGVYRCKLCFAPLYRSEDKFESTCGWPSFDGELAGAVTRKTDADGMRTEILCTECGGHLGHVFTGEQLTDNNIRHCVNSISMIFVSAEDEARTAKAYFAGGCFWGVEHLYEQKKGVISAVSGYMGGHKDNPTYHDVCYTNSGHLETVEVTYQPALLSYEEIAKFFFEIHDPTQANGQGPDLGAQYLSAIFYNNEEEKKKAEELIEILKGKGHKVVTKLLPANTTFWPAEENHQDYYARSGKQPYCHAHQKKF